MTKVPCSKCGAEILPSTADETGGLCMPCKNGYRDRIEASKRYYEELKKYDPYRELWMSLVDRVHHTDAGYDGLTRDERLYYALVVLQGEVYNGGFHQFFFNSSGGRCRDAIAGLELLDAQHSLSLLEQAKAALFGLAEPPEDQAERWEAMKQYSDDDAVPNWSIELAAIDKEFWQDPDKLSEKLDAFAVRRGLLDPFLQAPQQ
jgi:hypothetical protein